MPNKDKLALGKHLLMTDVSKSLRDKLEKYGTHARIQGRQDEFIKEELERRGRGRFWYPGISQDLLNGKLDTEKSYLSNPSFKQWLKQPGNEELANEVKKKSGELYQTTFSNLRPDQQQLSQDITKAAQQVLPNLYSKIGQPTSLEQPTNDLIMNLIKQYNQGGAMGDEYLSGFGAFPGLKENLSALASGAYNAGSALGRGAQQAGDVFYRRAQNAYGAINPYVQGAAAKGQSYLSAAQPYAQKAADLGGDIYNAIRAPAVSAAGAIKQGGLGSLLNILSGRM